MKKPDPTKKKTTMIERCKLRIDSRTIVIVKTKEALDMWMHRHPEARLIA